jgi:hypothetical protein
MKVRKVNEIVTALTSKGFELTNKGGAKKHHLQYYLIVGGKRSSIHTFISHGEKEYGKNLMGKIKNQLRFKDNTEAEGFFDCNVDGVTYLNSLKERKVI